MVNEIRAGMDHQDNYYEEGDNQFPRVTGQYGHAPGAEGASLETFVDAGDAGVAVLVQARGVSKGIADAAVDDIAGIRAVIARIQEYIDKARDAKSALEDEVARLRDNEIPRVTREAADKRAAAAALQSAASTPKCNISQRGAKPERRRSLHREA